MFSETSRVQIKIRVLHGNPLGIFKKTTQNVIGIFLCVSLHHEKITCFSTHTGQRFFYGRLRYWRDCFLTKKSPDYKRLIFSQKIFLGKIISFARVVMCEDFSFPRFLLVFGSCVVVCEDSDLFKIPYV